MFSPKQQQGLFVVTGASSGIGYRLCQRLLDAGLHVLGVSRRAAPFTQAHYQHVQGDLCQQEFVELLYNRLKSSSTPISALVFCHGQGRFGALEQFSYAAISQLMMVNFTSIAYMLRRTLPLLKQQQSGHVIAIGSEAALKGARQGSIYCASKFALRGMFQSLRAECANTSVSLSLIHPGMVNTPFFDELEFKHGENEGEYLTADNVVDCVFTVLQLPQNAIIDEISLTPRVNVVRKSNNNS